MRVLLTRCNVLNDVVYVNGAVISPYSPSAKFPGRFWCVRDFSVHLASRRLRAERRTGLADPPRTTRSLVAPASRACPRELTTPLARKPVRLGRKRDAAEAA